MDSSKISVIIPCYNVEKYVSECLDSVLSQSLEDIEVICVDDGSTDETLSILEKYEREDHRILIVRQEHSGPSVGRNKALSIAQGEYISFVDSDDKLAPDAYKACYSLACEYRADIALFNAETVFDSAEYKERFKSFEEEAQRDFANFTYARHGYESLNSKEHPLGGPALFSKMYPAGDYRAPIWLCLYRNAFLKEHGFGFIEGIFHADDVFSFKAIMAAKAVTFLDETLYYRRFRPGSIMTTPIDRRNTIARIIGQQEMQAYFDSIKPSLDENAIGVAQQYIADRRNGIASVYLKYLSDDDESVAYKNLFASLEKKESEPLAEPEPPLKSQDTPAKQPGILRLFSGIRRSR